MISIEINTYLNSQLYQIEIYDYENDKVIDTIIFDSNDFIEGISMSDDCTNKHILNDFIWSS